MTGLQGPRRWEERDQAQSVRTTNHTLATRFSTRRLDASLSDRFGSVSRVVWGRQEIV